MFNCWMDVEDDDNLFQNLTDDEGEMWSSLATHDDVVADEEETEGMG